MRASILFMSLWPVTLTLCGGAAGSDKYFLDLTIPEAEDRSLEGEVGWGGGAGSSSPPEVPLAVELKSLDKDIYTVGADLVVYEVRITNIGSTHVTLPWMPNRGLVWKGYRPGKRLSGLEATIGLEIVGKERGIGLDARGLYGKPDDPKTFLVLAPNESAVIRSSRRVAVDPRALSETDNNRTQSPKRIVVRASFNLTDWSHGRFYKRLESKNHKEIVLNWNGGEK
jgi:hypothetical protein